MDDNAETPADKPQDEALGWRERLRRWWHGDDYVAPEAGAPAAPSTAATGEAPAEAPAEDDQPTIADWRPRRQQIAQLLFGEGNHQPGGEEQMKVLTMPLGLNPNMSITELGCGMGGMTRMMAREGLWVDAYESDPQLFDAALEFAKKQGVKQRINLKGGPLDEITLKRRSIDAILSKEGLLGVQDKRLLLSKIRAALKPNGQLMFTDYLLTGDTSSRVHDVWMEREPVKPRLLTPADLQSELESLNFMVNYLEDVTAEYKATVIDAFARYDADIKQRGKAVPMAEREWVITEGEHWAIRISAMDANVIRVYRCFCRVVE